MGEIEETDDGVIVIRRIRVTHLLRVDELDDRTRAAADRCLGFHQRKCPVARTLERSIDISTELRIRVGDEG